MAWIGATIAAGTSVIGAISSHNASSSADKRADKRAYAAMMFAQTQYNDWKNVYGDLEENLSNYYNSITPDKYVTKAFDAYAKESSTALTRVREVLAQRGLQDSGAAGAVETKFALDTANTRAGIRTNADAAVAKEKASFLSIGLGHNLRGEVQSVFNTQYANAAKASANANIAEANATGAAVTAVGTALTDYLTRDKSTPAQSDKYYGVG